MDNDASSEPRSPGRENVLAIVLTLFLGGASLIFLIFVSGGFFFYVILVAAGLGLLGCLHYLLWGWAFNRSVAGERRKIEQEAEAHDRLSSRLPGERRFDI